MKDCPRCHGSGEIGWNDSPINDPQCAQEATCNVCHGEGVDPIGDRDEAVMAEHFETLEATAWDDAMERLTVRAEAAEARVAELEDALTSAKTHIETHWHGHGENGYFLRHAHEAICDALRAKERRCPRA